MMDGRTLIERRREYVRRRKFKHGWTDARIVRGLAKIGITTSRATVARDVQFLRAEYASVTRDFEPQAEIAIRSRSYLRIAENAERAAANTTDDGARARLLRVALNARRAENDLLMNVGLLPRDLGVLRVQPEAPEERLPSGLELIKLFESVTVEPDELVSEAERDYLHGDWAAADAAARDAKH